MLIFLRRKTNIRPYNSIISHLGTIIKGQFKSSFSQTEVTIPIPITGGHLAAQLWEGNKCMKSLASAYPTPILFMHGYQDNSCSFDPLIPLIIQNNMTIVSVDQPGHGLSSPLKSTGYDFILDGLSTIYRVMLHFHWTTVTLIGHSYGSILSFVFTGMNVDKVYKFVAIENLQPFGDSINLHLDSTIKTMFDVEAKVTDPSKVRPSYLYEVMLERAMKVRNGEVSEEGMTTLLKRGAVPNAKEPNLFQFSHDIKTNIPTHMGRFSNEESLIIAGHIKCPVCLIKGDPGDDFGVKESYMNTMDTIKTANGGKLELHLVPGNHHVHLNDPASVAPIISKFLSKQF